jgi:hypothetical protein
VPFDKAAATEDKATRSQALFKTGRGGVALGDLVLKVVPGPQSGRIVVIFQENKR